MKKSLTLFLFVMIRIIDSIGQPISFPADKGITTGNIIPIVLDHEIKGYYSVFYTERTADKMNEHNLVMMDVNFKIIKDFKFKVDPKLWLQNSEFNGEIFCFSVANENSGTIHHHFYNLEGDLVRRYELEDIKKIKIYPSYFDEMDVIPYTGFCRNGLNPKDEDYIEVLGNDGKLKWKLYPKDVVINGKSKGKELLTFNYADKEFLILTVELPKLNASDVEEKSNYFLRTLDVKTGKVLFEIDNRHSKGFLIPMGIQAGNNQITQFGQFFAYDRDKSGYNEKENLGFYTRTFDREGKIVFENFSTWKEDLSKFLALNEKEQIEGNRNFWIHAIIKTASGKYFVISEIYHRGFGNLLLNAGYAFVRDMMVFEFSPEFEITNVHRYEKDKSSTLVSKMSYISDYRVGEIIKLMYAFDYKFSSQSSDRTVFTSVYDNYDKTQEEKKYVIGAIALNRDQELVNPKIVLTNKPDEIKILPAKTGYVAIIEYFKKEKTATLTLHKFDM